MRISRVRFTVRRMMVAVAIVATFVWLSGPAIRVLCDPAGSWIHHYWRHPDPKTGWGGEGMVCHAPFWSRYWRVLVGRPWPGSYHCGCISTQDDVRSKWFVGSKTGPLEATWGGQVAPHGDDLYMRLFNSGRLRPGDSLPADLIPPEPL